MIPQESWLKAALHCPSEMKELMDLCCEFNKLYYNARPKLKISGIMDVEDLSNTQILTYRIIGCYMQLLELRFPDHKDVEKVRNDIWVALSIWFDTKGIPKNITREILGQIARKELDWYYPLSVTAIVGFIQSKIFDSLNEAYRETQKMSKKLFELVEAEPFAEKRDWVKMSRRVNDKDFEQLCLLCHKYESSVYSLSVIGVGALQTDIAKHSWLIEHIITKFIKTTNDFTPLQVVKDEHDFKSFLNDLYASLERFIRAKEIIVYGKFITSTAKKGGIYPKEKREEVLKLPKAEKEEKLPTEEAAVEVVTTKRKGRPPKNV